MGYDLHIHRGEDPFDEDAEPISFEEFRAVVDADPELSFAQIPPTEGDYVQVDWKDVVGAMWWHEGQVGTKNADVPRIIKLVAIADKLRARVFGDDGEIYRADGSSYEPDIAPPPRQGWFDRMIEAWRSRRSAAQLRRQTPAFHAGAVVRDMSGMRGVVLEFDPKGQGGMGTVKVRFDDGREVVRVSFASGLKIEK